MTKHLHWEANSSLASQEIRSILRKLWTLLPSSQQTATCPYYEPD